MFVLPMTVQILILGKHCPRVLIYDSKEKSSDTTRPSCKPKYELPLLGKALKQNELFYLPWSKRCLNWIISKTRYPLFFPDINNRFWGNFLERWETNIYFLYISGLCLNNPVNELSPLVGMSTAQLPQKSSWLLHLSHATASRLYAHKSGLGFSWSLT